MKTIKNMSKSEIIALYQAEQQKRIEAEQKALKSRKSKTFKVCNVKCAKNSNYHFSMSEIVTEQILKSDKFKAFIVDADADTLLSKNADIVVTNEFKDVYTKFVIETINKALKL
jgi:hypothetical protein